MKLVCPATLSFSLLDSSREGRGAGTSRSPLRKVTLRNILRRSFSFGAAGSSVEWVSFSLPFFLLPVIVANSSTGGAGSFLDRVAVRKLCSREERNRWNDLEGCSGAEGDPNTSSTMVGWGYREEEASGLSFGRRGLDDTVNREGPDTLAPWRTAVAMRAHGRQCRGQKGRLLGGTWGGYQ